MQSKMASHGGNHADKISHIGMAFRASDLPQDHDLYDEKAIYCWESTMSGPLAFDKVRNVCASKCYCGNIWGCCCQSLWPKVPHRMGFLGTQFRDLNKLAIYYDSHKNAKLVWMPLNKENRAIADDVIQNKNRLVKMIDRWNGVSYNATCCCLDLWANAFSCCNGLKKLYSFCFQFDDQGSQFCSQFAASIYKTIGVIEKSVDTSKVAPSDFLVAVDKSGVIKSLDADGEIPNLFHCFILFTKRSNYPNTLLLPNFMDGLHELDGQNNESGFVDHSDLDRDLKAYVLNQKSKTTINPSIPIAGSTDYKIV